MASRSRLQLENWLKTITIPAMSKVLDIGGSQNPVRNRLLFFDNNGEYKILDLEQPHECKVKPAIMFDIQTEIPKRELEKYLFFDKFCKGFDIAFCLEVSEYWYNPLLALKNINWFLKEGGTLYISFHTLYGLHKPEWLVYLNYTKYGIEKLLKETGFQIEEMIPKTITEDGRQALIEFYKAEGMKILYNSETFKEGYLVKATKI